MDKIRIGVMGCANIAQRSVIPAILEVDMLELVAVASRTQEKADEFASRFQCRGVAGYDRLLELDIDAVYMPLPTGLHEEWVTKTLEAGKHVLVEKSLAMNYESAKKMADQALAKNLVIMENFMFLYHSQHKFVANLIEKGEIGEIRTFRSSFGFPPLDQDNFRYNLELGGGALLDAAAYTVRASQLFLGDDLSVQGASMTYDSNSGVDLYGGAFLKGPDGKHAEVAWGFDNLYQCNYEIWGSQGMIVAQRSFTPGPDFEPTITVKQQGEEVDHKVDKDHHFVNILNEFARCIKEGIVQPKVDEILNQSRLLDEVKAAANE